MLKAMKPLAFLVLTLSIVACKPQAPVGGTAPVVSETEALPSATTELKDAVETDPRFIIGVSYPPKVNTYPGLVTAIDAYVKAEREELMQAVAALGNDKPIAPYELSLSFQELVATPDIVAIGGDGSRYTGGAHGDPLVARFVWLPKQNKMLQATDLIADAKGWMAVSSYASEQLRTQVSVRADADELSPEERQNFVSNADKMIEAGTEADPANFSQFQPLLDAAGKITALRFVFPPYQVGPYADGTQSVDVPTSVLTPYLAPAYLELFAR